MIDLRAFLDPARVENEELVVSDRFRDESGAPVPFTIRPITQEENDVLVCKSTHMAKVGGRKVEKLDHLEYGRRVVVAATVCPDFTSEELCRAYGTMDPLEVPGRMLLMGEYNKLSAAIMALSGLGDSQDALEEQAKN